MSGMHSNTPQNEHSTSTSPREIVSIRSSSPLQTVFGTPIPGAIVLATQVEALAHDLSQLIRFSSASNAKVQLANAFRDEYVSFLQTLQIGSAVDPIASPTPSLSLSEPSSPPSSTRASSPSPSLTVTSYSSSARPSTSSSAEPFPSIFLPSSEQLTHLANWLHGAISRQISEDTKFTVDDTVIYGAIRSELFDLIPLPHPCRCSDCKSPKFQAALLLIADLIVSMEEKTLGWKEDEEWYQGWINGWRNAYFRSDRENKRLKKVLASLWRALQKVRDGGELERAPEEQHLSPADGNASAGGGGTDGRRSRRGYLRGLVKKGLQKLRCHRRL